MRDVGYNLETALADIVDNAISAAARSISVLADTSSTHPRLAILDDGVGMDASGLLEAMRLGSRSPRDERDHNDLGRFGLGLKTASFSQCRRLSVVSRKNGKIAAARWDLDEVADADDWMVEIPAAPLEIPWAKDLPTSGTLVVWEKMDRLTAGERIGIDGRYLVRLLNDAAEHLELVFHRFLAGERGLKRVSISLNGRPLSPYDPFHSSHSATIAGPLETVRIGQHQITIKAFTLPHHKKVSPAEWDRYAGTAGYIKNQGFYVYRNKRLIINGTWFGLARQSELTKLARVRIDMPNGLDAEWKIDIKKASAQLPPQVRERLRLLIETIGATSKRVYTVRGRRLIADSRLPVWQREQNKNEIRYRINREHPALTDFFGRLPDDLQKDFVGIVEMVGAAMPIDALFADVSGQPAEVAGNIMSEEALGGIVAATYRQLRRSSIGADDIAAMLQVTEPFRSNWELTAKRLDDLRRQEPINV
jgi:hypothetical protein